MHVRRPPPVLAAALALMLGAGAGSLTAPAPAAAQDQPGASALAAWVDCSTQEAARLDDGHSDAATIADALTSSCQTEWDASKAEQCRAADLTPEACAMLSNKLEASRRAYEIKVVLAFRAAKAPAAEP